MLSARVPRVPRRDTVGEADVIPVNGALDVESDALRASRSPRPRNRRGAQDAVGSGAPRVSRRVTVGVLALRAAGARLPKRWPPASAVRQTSRPTRPACTSAADVESDGVRISRKQRG